MQKFNLRSAVAAIAILGLAACGGGGSSGVIPFATRTSAPATVHAKSSVRFKIAIPKASRASSAALRERSIRATSGKRPHYVSVDTASATIALTSVNGAAAPAGFPAVSTALTTGSPDCSSATGTLTCSLGVPAPVGNDTFTVTLYDANANALSSNAETVTIVAGQIAIAQPLVLEGIAASYTLTPASDQGTTHHVQPSGGGYGIVGARPYVFTVAPIDASGAMIIGPGAPATTLTSPSAAVTVTPVSGNSQQFSVQIAAYSATPISLSESATGGPAATVPISILPEIWVAGNSGQAAANTIFGLVNVGSTLIPVDGIELYPGPIVNYDTTEGLAIDHAGQVWATDVFNQSLTSYLPGTPFPITSVPTESIFAAQGTAADPLGIAVDPSGNLWIADDASISPSGIGIQEINPATGAFIANPLDAVLANAPWLAFDHFGNLFITSSDYNAQTGSIAKYAVTSATPVGTYAAGCFLYGIAIDNEGDVWAPCNSGTSVTALDGATFAPVSGRTLTGLSNPAGIAVDAADNVYVVESNDVKAFTVTGQLEATTPTGLLSNYESIAVQI